MSLLNPFQERAGVMHGEPELRIFPQNPKRLVVAVPEAPFENMVEISYRLVVVEAEDKPAFCHGFLWMRR